MVVGGGDPDVQKVEHSLSRWTKDGGKLMARITCILYQFPQLSESYAQTELGALAADHHLDVISLGKPDTLGAHDVPYIEVGDSDELFQHVRDFRPNVIHTHWLGLQRKDVSMG